MQRSIALAALLALALAVGGVSAATTTSPSPGVAPAATDVVQPAEYTVETIDPDDELTDADIETARELAWANDTVRSAVDADKPVLFEVQAPATESDQVTVQVEQNGRLAVVADIDRTAETVVGIEDPVTLTADQAVQIDTDHSAEPSDDTEVDDDMTAEDDS